MGERKRAKKKQSHIRRNIWQFDVPTSGWLLHSKYHGVWFHFLISFLIWLALISGVVCVFLLLFCVYFFVCESLTRSAVKIVHNLLQLNVTDTLNYDFFFYIDQFNAQIKWSLNSMLITQLRFKDTRSVVYFCLTHKVVSFKIELVVSSCDRFFFQIIWINRCK